MSRSASSIRAAVLSCLLALCLVVVLLSAPPAAAATVGSDGWGTSAEQIANAGAGANDDVLATALASDGDALVGGEFTTFAGAPAGGLVRLDPDGTRDAAFDAQVGSGATTGGARGAVRSVVELADGGLLVGGEFDAFNGVAAGGLVRLAADGSVDQAFTANVGSGPSLSAGAGAVNAVLPLSDGGFLVGGYWLSFSGVATRSLVRLNADGTPDTQFAANLAGGVGSASVYSVAELAGGDLLVGGAFSTFGGAPAGRVVRLDPDGSRDAAFDAAVGTAASSNVRTVRELADGRLLLVGLFSSFGGTPAGHVVVLHADGTRDAAFDARVGTGADGTLDTAVELPDGRILLGGGSGFDEFDGVPAPGRLVLLDGDGTRDTAFDADLGAGFASNHVGSFLDAAAAPGRLLLGGTFAVLNGAPVSRHVLQLQAASASIETLGDQESSTGAPVTPVQVVGTFSDGGTPEFTATGLPPGVTIDPASGVVSGTPTAAGVFAVTVDATRRDAVLEPLTAGTSFTWRVIGVPDASTSTITATPAAITAGASSTVTVTLADAAGDPLGAAGAGRAVVLTTDLGTLGPVTDAGDGTYTATLTSTAVGTATVGFAVDGTSSTSTATVTVAAGVPDAGASDITASPAAITAGGSSTLTVTLRDAHGNALGAAGAGVPVGMSTDLGELSAVEDIGDGTYTATLTSTVAGTATVGFAVDGTVSATTATVTVAPADVPGTGGNGGTGGTDGTDGTDGGTGTDPAPGGAHVPRLAITGADLVAVWALLAGLLIAGGAVAVRRARVGARVQR